MSTRKILVLGNQPFLEHEQLITLDLFRMEQILGTGTKLIVDAQVTLGKCHFYSIPPTKPPIIDRTKSALYLIDVPFTLHKLAGDKYCQELVFRVSLDNQDTTAFSLFPKSIITKEESTRTFTLAPEIQIMGPNGNAGINIKPGEISKQIRFESLRPVITASGEGESTFFWTYSSIERQGVTPETKHGLIILEVPLGTTSVKGSINSRATIVKKELGVWEHRNLKTDDYPIYWVLTGAPSL